MNVVVNDMNIKKLKNILDEKGIVKFKIYSLHYVIKNENDTIVIYPLNNENRKSNYKNIDLLLKKYMIFDENLKDNDKEIIIID